MVDISCLDDYIIDMLDKYYLLAEQEVETQGFDKHFDFTINYLDCTKILSNGQRAMQTIGYLYAKNITQLIHVIKKYTDGEKQDHCFNKLIERHNLNLEFEKTTPPEWYTKDKKKPKTIKTTKEKVKKERKPKEKGVNAAQRKLAAKVAKLNSLSINLPIKKV